MAIAHSHTLTMNPPAMGGFCFPLMGCTMSTILAEARHSPMSIIQVNHIQSNCRARFASLIDMSDVTTQDAEEKDCNFLTRALAAFSMAALAKIEDNVAAKSVVDEYHDDGIDAFYFDRSEHVAYLVQSKWQRNGAGSLDL